MEEILNKPAPSAHIQYSHKLDYSNSNPGFISGSNFLTLHRRTDRNMFIAVIFGKYHILGVHHQIYIMDYTMHKTETTN